MRETIDKGTTSPKIQEMRNYIKVVQENLAVEEKKVKEQKDQVTQAEKNLDQAREELRRKRQEVDKLHTHQKDWEKEMRKEQEVLEGREQDEIGNIIFSTKRRREI